VQLSNGEPTGNVELIREIICSVQAWDAETGIRATLEPGTHADECRIHKNEQSEIDSGAEPYEMRFVAHGRRYRCDLPRFQARTCARVGNPGTGFETPRLLEPLKL
jgi:hypothetical protein